MTEKHTRLACYLGMVTQAVSINFPALLFVVFYQDYKVSLSALGVLIILTFVVQLVIDLLCARYIDRIGYRLASLGAAGFSGVGMLLLPLLVRTLPVEHAFTGIVAAILFTSIGSGLLEVVVSPILEALPSEKKSADMAILHAAYCWGHVLCVLVSTLFFVLYGLRHWPVLSVIWSLIPFAAFYLFLFAPLSHPVAEGKTPMRLRDLFGSKVFLLLVFVMVCSGAAEQSMAQWASLFAQLGMGVSKTMGDLMGPLLFAVLMGASRTYYGVKGCEIDLEKELKRNAILGVFGYLLAVFGHYPLLNLAGCGICGLAVGLMWPGTISLGARLFPLGGSALFSLLAMGGDIGCALGPGMVGCISDWAQTLCSNHESIRMAISKCTGSTEVTQLGLKAGLFLALVFPGGVYFLVRRIQRRIKKV
ncbi:MAG: MFS transporter [Kiritimatiellia bacterium]